MSNSTDLLPCPFCGSPAILIEGHREHWRAQCSKCGANIGEFFANRSRREDQRLATEAWNTRTPDPEAARLRETLEDFQIWIYRVLDGEDGANYLEGEGDDGHDAWFDLGALSERARAALSPHPDGERG
jgi:Lar family restriction alleviation protein